MKFIVIISFLFFLSTSIRAQNTSNSFWARSELSAAYNFVDTWRRCEISSTQLCKEEAKNEVQSFSLSYGYMFKNNILAQFSYTIDQEKHYDLQRTFYNASYFLRLGYRYEVNKLNSLTPRLGFGVIVKPNYSIYRTGIIEQPLDTYSTQMRYSGKTAFTHWTLGLDYRHSLTEKVFIGLSADVAYNFTFKYGRTYLSPYVGINLGKD